MAQVGGKHGQPPLGILTGSVPLHQGIGCEPMTQVVARGTGKKSRIREYPSFGKTGTAQKLDPQTGTYSHSKYIASFVCGAPIEDPQVLVLVMVDEPNDGSTGFGGDVAAPTAGRLLQKALVHLRVPGTAIRTLPERE